MVLRHFSHDTFNQPFARGNELLNRHRFIGHAVEAMHELLGNVLPMGRKNFPHRAVVAQHVDDESAPKRVVDSLVGQKFAARRKNREDAGGQGQQRPCPRTDRQKKQAAFPQNRTYLRPAATRRPSRAERRNRAKPGSPRSRSARPENAPVALRSFLRSSTPRPGPRKPASRPHRNPFHGRVDRIQGGRTRFDRDISGIDIDRQPRHVANEQIDGSSAFEGKALFFARHQATALTKSEA